MITQARTLEQVVESLLSHICTDKTNTFLTDSLHSFSFLLNRTIFPFLRPAHVPSPPCLSSLPAPDSESFPSESHPVRFPSPFNLLPLHFTFLPLLSFSLLSPSVGGSDLSLPSSSTVPSRFSAFSVIFIFESA